MTATDRSIAYGICQAIQRKGQPSIKQAIQGKRILEEAKRLGFHYGPKE